MAISAEKVKELRDKTGVSMMACKAALEEAEGDFDKAIAILGNRAASQAGKKADRALGAGAVAAYVHSNAQVGAMVSLACETDFVAKNEEFTRLAYDIAMHAAAMRPQTIEELVAQSFIKDPSKTILDLVSGATQKFGERVEIRHFSVIDTN